MCFYNEHMLRLLLHDLIVHCKPDVDLSLWRKFGSFHSVFFFFFKGQCGFGLSVLPIYLNVISLERTEEISSNLAQISKMKLIEIWLHHHVKTIGQAGTRGAGQAGEALLIQRAA